MYMRWWMDSLAAIKKHRIKHNARIWTKRCMVLILTCSLFATAGCTLLPTEAAIEVVPIIDPPKIAQKPEYNVVSATIEQKVRASGKLMSLQESQLYFRSDNYRIQAIHVKTGDTVKQGQLIAELETGDLESQIKQKDIQLQKAELLMKDKLRNVTEQNESATKLDQLDLQLQQEELAKLKQTLAKARMVAPFAGVITFVAKNEGDMEKAYETIAVISNPAKLTVVARFSTSDLNSVIVGMEAVVDINTVGQFKGKVVKLPVVKENQTNQTQTIDDYVVIQLDQMPSGLIENTPLSASIITDSKAKAVQIPLAALRTQGGRNYVLAVDGSGNKREVDVEIGLTTATEVEIVKGLTPGQKVVGK
jgi:membrane fusion protein, macrolide-specific efflux system